MISKYRIISLFLIHFLIFLHIYYFGSDVVGSIDFQEFFHSFIKLGVLNAGVILVIIAFLSTLIFGRFFCGWACHFGAIQEFSWYILNKLNIKPKTIDSKLVTILPFIILLNYYILPNIYYSIHTPWEEIKISLNEPGIWEFLPGFIIGTLTFFVDGFLIVYFLGRKGFCRFICPWGAFLKFPNSLALFKVRKTGNCTQCHVCTSECPVGIDVSFEINTYNKVTNTNCTSCLNCTYGCPSNALSYTYMSPIKEEFNIKNYLSNQGSYIHENIKNKFNNIRNIDYKFLLLTIFYSVSIDGLYGMGHFLSYGIGIIVAYTHLVLCKNIKIVYKSFVIGLFLVIAVWHGIIKLSIQQGYYHYENGNYNKSITHLNRAVILYPKQIGKFYVLLSNMYLELNKNDLALENALLALKINPTHKAPQQLIKLIEKNKK